MSKLMLGYLPGGKIISYATTADERLDTVKASLREAILALTDIVVNDCYGSNDYNTEYSDKFPYALSELIKLRGMFH